VGTRDAVRVFADLHEIDAPRVRLGAKATVTFLAYPDAHRETAIDWVAQTLDPVTRTTRVRVTLANADGTIHPEMFASLSIVTAPRSVLAVPRESVIRMGERTVAFRVEGRESDGKVHLQRLPVFVDDVTPDDGPARGAEWAIVLRGLRRGDEVVTTGVRELSAGR